MKWIAVLLVLANVAAYFWVQQDESSNLGLDPNRFDAVNLERMTLQSPADSGVNAESLQEDVVTQIDLTEAGAPKVRTFQGVDEGAAAATDKVLEPKRDDEQGDAQAANEVADLQAQQEQAARQAEQTKAKELKIAEAKAAEAKVAEAKTKAADEAATQVAKAQSANCYRVGPYAEEEAFNEAVTLLANNQIKHKADAFAKQQVKATRVHLGPFADAGELQAGKAQLKAKGIDHYAIKFNGRSHLQLGYFSNLQRGENYQNKMKGLGFDAKLEKVYKSDSPASWVYFAVDDASGLKQLDDLKRYPAAAIEEHKCSKL